MLHSEIPLSYSPPPPTLPQGYVIVPAYQCHFHRQPCLKKGVRKVRQNGRRLQIRECDPVPRGAKTGAGGLNSAQCRQLDITKA
ncbi:hypothetical protein SRHO_G00150140 [Serrasalmus rhombeus]